MKIIRKILFLIILVVSVMGVWSMAKQKPGMVLDEYFSYGLANSTYDTNQGRYCIYLPQGVMKEPKSFFDNYFFASSFSLENVWANQSYDVHPPIYYLALHLLGRLTHNVWRFDTGIVLNMVLHVINIVLIYTIIRCVIKEKVWAYIGSIWYAFLPTVIEQALYIRMYYLLLTEFLILMLWMLIGYRIREKEVFLKIIFYLGVGVLSVTGVLTHYYFVGYLFFICLVWGVYLLYKRVWKEVVAFLLTMGVAGLSCFSIFPGMQYHILEGNRGQESIDSLLHSNFKDFMVYYGEILEHLTGGILFIWLVCGILLVIGFIRKHKMNLFESVNWEYALIVIPAGMYYLTISKIGVIKSSRFISPVFGVMIIALVTVLYLVVKWIHGRWNISYVKLDVLSIAVIFAILFAEWYDFSWNELSMDNHEAKEIAKHYGEDNDCFYIWQFSEHSMVSYDEFKEYEHIYFWQNGTSAQEMKDVIKNYEHLVVYFNCAGQLDQECQKKYLDEILQQSDKMNTYTHLYDGDFNCAYYLE